MELRGLINSNRAELCQRAAGRSSSKPQDRAHPNPPPTTAPNPTMHSSPNGAHLCCAPFYPPHPFKDRDACRIR